MKRSLDCFVTTGLLIAAALVTVQPLPAQTAENPDTAKADNPSSVTAWGMQIAAIPSILRMHCPVLNDNVGVLVAEVTAGSPADREGLRRGDVVLEVNGSRIHDTADLPAPALDSSIIVLRRGRVQTMGQMGSARPGFSNDPGDDVRRMVQRMIRQTPQPPAIAPPSRWIRPDGSFGTGANSGAYASSSSSGNESMSVSQANDQISVEMSSPDGGAPIRLQGTMAEIQQQMQTQGLSHNTKQRILRALGR